MTETANLPSYKVSIFESKHSPGEFLFTFLPKGMQQARGVNGAPKRVPHYLVSVRRSGTDISLIWDSTADDPGSARPDLEREVHARLRDRDAWIDRVAKLVEQVQLWGKELGWETRRIEKQLDDSWVGSHVVPALLMQRETFKVLLEPVGRSAPGVEGIVDLYVMPAYDDIASLYFYDGRWNLRYARRNTVPIAKVPEATKELLTKEAVGRVLDEMTAHAA